MSKRIDILSLEFEILFEGFDEFQFARVHI